MAIDINIPSQVKNYANLAAFPATGTLKTIFIAEDTNKTYRWTGSAYVEISASQATAWGAITGTLSSQTDLNTALSGKVPTTRTLTINGTTQDLSADRTFTISTGITIGTTAITSGTVGRVLFEGTGNVVQESANLFWNNTSSRLGIGTSTPTSALQIVGSTNVEGLLNITNNTTLNFANAVNILFPNTLNGNQVAGFYIGKALSSKNGWGVSYTHSTDGSNSNRGSIDFFGVNSILNWFASGNVSINTTTDAGFKLDVNGTARVVGSMLVQGMTVGLGGGANVNSVAIGKEALQNNTTYQNCAVGYRALYNNTGGDNTAIGAFYAMFANTTGGRNTGIGTYALNGNTTGQWNSALGYNTSSGNFDGSVILGYGAGATASNQFVAGSSAVNAGAVTTETNSSTQVWNVIINGVARKILLA